MNLKQNFPLFSIVVDNKRVIESENIKIRVLQIVHENSFCLEKESFDYYLENNQITNVKLVSSMKYEDFIENKISSKTFKILCKNAILNPEKKFVLILENYQFGNMENIFEDILPLLKENKRLESKNELKVKLKYENNLFGVPLNLYILCVINKR